MTHHRGQTAVGADAYGTGLARHSFVAERFAIVTTDTDFFVRADMMNTQLGQAEKDDAANVAKPGYTAMLRGDGQVVTGWGSKMQAAMAHVLPADVLAEMHRRKAEPGRAHS